MAGAGGRYGTIGRSYSRTRREDARIAAEIHVALGAGGPMVNVGAGYRNYEPADRNVVAVEPSQQMIDHRVGRPAPVVRGTDERLLSTHLDVHGEWDRRHGHLRHRAAFDGGYRIAIASS